MNIVFRFPTWVMIIGIGHPGGFWEVPEAKFIKYMLAGFISTMLIPPAVCGEWALPVCSSCAVAG
jgi:hypothetical protein